MTSLPEIGGSPTSATARPRQPSAALLRHPAWWLAVGYFTLLVIAYQVPPGVQFFDILAGPLQYLPLCLIAAIAFAMATRRGAVLHPQTRDSLTLISAALLLFAVGMTCYTWSHVVTGTALGEPIVGDLFYIPGYALLLVALVRLPARSVGAYRSWHFALDAGVVLVGVGLLTWYIVIRPTTGVAADESSVLVTLAYPVLGIGFLLALNALVLRDGPVDGGRAFRWLAAAVTLYVVADTGYQLLYYRGRSATPGLERLDESAYALAYLGLVAAGLCYAANGPGERRRPPRELHAFSPLPLLVTTVVAVLLAAVAVERWTTDASPLVLGLVVLTFLLILRQGFTARQNSALLKAESQRKGDERVAALVRHASDLIVVTEPDGRIRFASPSLEHLLGMSPAKVTGVSLASLIVSDDWAAFSRAAPADPGRKVMLTARFQHADGSTRECEVAATDLSSEPAIGGIVYVARDLSERRALEQRLQQAHKMEAVGRLAGGIAHDFNNLLTTILAETELLLDPGIDRSLAHDELETIHAAAQNAAALTRQLLTFSRRQMKSVRSVNLDALLSSTVRMFGRSPSGVAIQRHAEPGLRPVTADPHQLSQMLLNLLLNSRDAMPEGGTIVVSMVNVRLYDPSHSTILSAPPGEYVEIVVADTGVGMDESIRDRVFEPFFTTKASGRGTGLGLPSVLSTVEQHGGGLSLRSAPGAGTRISILLPVATAAEEEVTGESEPVGDCDRAPGGRERILLVDDEESVRDVTRRILERLGYVVETAAGADQARRVIAVTGCPDLLVTDVIMPDESGPQLAEGLVSRCPSLPVLYISGYTGDELQRQGTLRPGITFLQKPYTPRELGDRVRAMLDDAGQSAGAGAGENPAMVRS